MIDLLPSSRTSTTYKRRATASVFATVLAPLFATPPSTHFSRSPGLPGTLRDGTDPLLGGQSGTLGAGLQPAYQRLGDTS